MEDVSNFCPAIAVPITVKIPEPITAPMPSAVRETGPSVFFNRRSGCSESVISFSMDLQQSSWLLPAFGSRLTVVWDCDNGPHSRNNARVPHPGRAFATRVGTAKAGEGARPTQVYYRFACPRAIFLTFCFFDPRAYSRGF